MPGPDAATAAVRSAVRAALAQCTPGDLLLVACSGGADSLALAAALAFEAPKLAVRAGAVVVDHRLQPDSAVIAERAAEQCRHLGLDPVQVCRVVVPEGPDGLEAAARTARYAALEDQAERFGPAIVLLGHTLDDQAEQVLLGLARGSGARSLSGMPPARGRFHRPLLSVTRAQTRASCLAEGIPWWEDPMNDDPAYTRVRARRALADLEKDLGPGLAAALARTAAQLREDADLLDSLAADAVPPGPPFEVSALLALPRALRTRVWRRLLVAAGAPAGQVSTRHTDGCDRLLTHWRGQGPLHVPGDLRVRREGAAIEIGPEQVR